MSISQRNSNVELLRILCMFFVVLLHFNNHGINADIIGFHGNLTLQNGIGHFIESFAIVAVNCYILISGYFGIKFGIKGLLRLYFSCFFMGLIGYILYIMFTDNALSVTILFARFMAFTHNRWWFVIAYLFLFFIAPLLNHAINTMSKKQFQYALLLLLSIYTFYIGYVRNLGDNSIGMSYAQFIFLYLIGRYVGIYLPSEIIVKKRYFWLSGYLIMTLCTFILALLKQGTDINCDFLRPYPYNSWFVVGGALFLLLFLLSFDFYNNIINWLASSVFSVYLLQESSYFGVQVLYPWTESTFPLIDDLVIKYVFYFY